MKSYHNGLTPQEDEVLKHLVIAWNEFNTLKRMHPDEIDDFRRAIHTAQMLLAMRVVRRDRPEGWPTYE